MSVFTNRIAVLAATVIFSGAGCSYKADVSVSDEGPDSTADAGDVPSDIPSELPDTLTMDDEIRLNQIQVKGTHNSYHVITYPEMEDWACNMDPLDVQLDEQGVRQVELDLHLNYDGTIDVFHVPFADPGTTCSKFSECLQLIRTWSQGHPGHLPLTILIEPKDEMDGEDLTLAGKMGLIEDEIKAVFSVPEIITPDEIRGTHATLREALAADGWPTLRQVRNRVMFVMLDNAEHLDEYLQLRPNLEGAVIFARNGRGEPWSSVLELNGPDNPDREAEIRQAVLENYLVRSDSDGVKTTPEAFEVQAAAALRSGAHLINTDHPAVHNVTTGTGAGYAFDIPEGNPARCNPVNAPEGCTPEKLENLR